MLNEKLKGILLRAEMFAQHQLHNAHMLRYDINDLAETGLFDAKTIQLGPEKIDELMLNLINSTSEFYSGLDQMKLHIKGQLSLSEVQYSIFIAFLNHIKNEGSTNESMRRLGKGKHPRLSFSFKDSAQSVLDSVTSTNILDIFLQNNIVHKINRRSYRDREKNIGLEFLSFTEKPNKENIDSFFSPLPQRNKRNITLYSNNPETIRVQTQFLYEKKLHTVVKEYVFLGEIEGELSDIKFVYGMNESCSRKVNISEIDEREAKSFIIKLS
jgi:hypothetical protein